MTHIDPSPEGWQAFKDLPRDRPIQMLNLVKYRKVAEYPADHPDHGNGRSGAEAYAIYRAGFQALVANCGAAMIWEPPLECVVIGPADEWDEIFVMGYPDSASFLGLVKNADSIRGVVPHRTAAVADSRLIRFGS